MKAARILKHKINSDTVTTGILVSNLRYLYSVPFDIATAPVQFIVILFALATGAPG